MRMTEEGISQGWEQSHQSMAAWHTTEERFCREWSIRPKAERGGRKMKYYLFFFLQIESHGDFGRAIVAECWGLFRCNAFMNE